MSSPFQMRLGAVLAFALFIGMLGPWLYTMWAIQAVNHDIFWLTTAAGRLWQGGKIGVDVYETNPPLSILLYLPVYLLTQAGSAVEHAALIYTLLLLALTFSAVMAILRTWPDMDQAMRLVIGLTLLLSGTILSSPHFGQRDQILFFGLMPLLLVQISITNGIKLPCLLQCFVLFFGALVLMLKPHYGILPALALIHRMMVRRQIGFDIDLVILAAVTFGYSLMVWKMFPDYIHTILPDALRLYAMDGPGTAWDIIALVAIVGVITLSIAWRQRIPVAVWFAIAGFCSLFVFALMQRNYMYQLLPTLSFFVLAISLLLFTGLRRKIETGSAQVVTLLAVSGLCLFLPHSYYPSRQQLTEMPLSAILMKNCPQPCRFMLWSDNVRVTQLTARYAGAESASRFPGLWFLHGVRNNDELRRKYAAMMAEDILAYRPDTVISCNEYGDDIGLFSIAPIFAVQWKSYHKQGYVDLEKSRYEFGTKRNNWPIQRCNIYQRR